MLLSVLFLNIMSCYLCSQTLQDCDHDDTQCSCLCNQNNVAHIKDNATFIRHEFYKFKPIGNIVIQILLISDIFHPPCLS